MPPPMTRVPHQIASGVQSLYEARSIGDAELTSAGRFYRDYVHGIEGMRETKRMGSNSGAPALTWLRRLWAWLRDPERCPECGLTRKKADIVRCPCDWRDGHDI
jgi:hypothetical protein